MRSTRMQVNLEKNDKAPLGGFLLCGQTLKLDSLYYRSKTMKRQRPL